MWIYPIRVRQYFRSVLTQLLPEDEAALCRAVLIGDKYALSCDLRSQFKMSGASYFVVVSGMHFSFFILTLMFVFRKILRRKILCLLLILFTLFYMAVTAFSPSVVRSGVMMIFFLIGGFFRRRVYPLNSLGLAGLLTPVIFSPYCAGDLGLLLSYFATFAILMWSNPIYDRIRIKEKPGEKKKRLVAAVNTVLRYFSATLAATAMVFPISVFAFRAFSSVTLLSAALLYVEIAGILLFGVVVCVLWLIPPIRFIAILFSWVLYALCKAALFVVDTLSSMPFSYLKTEDVFVYIWIVTAILLFAVTFFFGRSFRSAVLCALCCVMLLLGGALSSLLIQTDAPVLTVCGAGSGMMATFRADGNTYLLCNDAPPLAQYQVLREVSDGTREVKLSVVDTSMIKTVRCCRTAQRGTAMCTRYRSARIPLSRCFPQGARRRR